MKTLVIAALGAVLAVASPAVAQEAPKADVPAPPDAAPAAAEVAPRTAPPARGPTAAVYGYVNLQYSRTDARAPANDSATFETRRARIGARGEVVPAVGYTVLFDAADTSLKDAYLAGKKLGVPGLELRAGQWKTPFGYEQPESDTKLLWVYSSYVVQALARSSSTTSLYATPDSRDLGVGVTGRWALPAGLGAEAAASVTNGAGPNRKDDLDEKDVWARAGLTAKAGRTSFRAGGSYGYGHQLAGLGANGKFDGVGTPVDDVSFYFVTYGADLEVDSPWFFVAAEVIQSERDVWDHGTGARPKFDARGWYAGVYGKTPWNVGPVFRAERYDRNRSVARDLAERYTVGAYADLLPVNVRLVLNYEFDESDRAVRAGNRAIALGQVIF